MQLLRWEMEDSSVIEVPQVSYVGAERFVRVNVREVLSCTTIRSFFSKKEENFQKKQCLNQ